MLAVVISKWWYNQWLLFYHLYFYILPVFYIVNIYYLFYNQIFFSENTSSSQPSLLFVSLKHFFEGVEARVAQGIREEEVSYQLAFNKQELRKVIKEYPGKEVKKGLDNLYKKVDKHLCEEENLLQVCLVLLTILDCMPLHTLLFSKTSLWKCYRFSNFKESSIKYRPD